MNFLILFLLIPLSSFAGSPPACHELEKYIMDFEKDLQAKTINECGSLDIKKFIAERPVATSEFLEANKCSDLATIETELENLKIQESVLTGINKLKASVDQSKQNTKSNNSNTQRVAGMKFVDSLKTAQQLETLLHTEFGEEKIPLVQLLNEKEDLSADNIEYAVKQICKTHKVKTGACDEKIFSPKGEPANELVNLIKSTKPTPKQVESWKKMLLIEKKEPAEGEDPTYSFNQMQQELSGAFDKIDKKEVLTKEHIAAIQRLSDFKNAKGLSFVEDIAALSDSKKQKIESDKFFLLMGDAKQRQMFEVQAKLSSSLGKMDLSALSPEQKAICESSGKDFQKAQSCLESLEKNLGKMTDNKANTARLLPALRTAVDYVSFLDEKSRTCEEGMKVQEKITEPCFTDLNKDLAAVQQQIMQLNTLKDKIGEENVDLMTFRNLAITKWGPQKCHKLSSNIDFCEEGVSISKEANLIYSDTMDITVLFSPKPEAETEAEELCSDEERKFTKAQERLCEFFNDTTSNNVVTDNRKNDIDGPTHAPDGEHEKAALRDAWIQGGANVLTQALGGILQNKYRNQYVNPYQYNYTPWGATGRPMGIADSIMFNARYYGAYGFYMPAQSSFAYSNAGLGMTPYSAYNYSSTTSNAGKYFGF